MDKKQWFFFWLWLIVMIVLGIGCYSERAEAQDVQEELGFVMCFYVGEFESISAEITDEMFSQLTAGIQKLPKGLLMSVRLRVYTDSLGTETANIEVGKKRFLALAAALRSLPVKVDFLTHQVCTYGSGENENNRRFAIVEFWAPISSIKSDAKRLQTVIDLQKQSSQQLSELLKEKGISLQAQQRIFEDISFQMGELSNAVVNLAKMQTTTNSAISDLREGLQKSDTETKKTVIALVLAIAAFVVIISIAYLFLSAYQEKRLNMMNEERHQETIEAIEDKSLKVILDEPINKKVEVRITLLGKKYSLLCEHIRKADGEEYWESPFVFSSNSRDRIKGKTRKKLNGNIKHFAKSNLVEQMLALVKTGMMTKI